MVEPVQLYGASGEASAAEDGGWREGEEGESAARGDSHHVAEGEDIRGDGGGETGRGDCDHCNGPVGGEAVRGSGAEDEPVRRVAAAPWNRGD